MPGGEGSRPRAEPGVAVDGRSLAPPRTGIGVFTAALIDRWVAAGHEVTVLVAAGTRLDTTSVPAPVIPLGPTFHLNAAAFARRHGLRYFSPDSLIVPALLGAAATATVHDLAPVDHAHSHTWRVRTAYRLLLGAAARRAGAVVVPSYATRSRLLHRYPRAPVTVVGEGPRSLPSPAEIPGGVHPPYLLCVGALEPRKHPTELAAAFLDVAPEPWQLVFAGQPRWLTRRESAQLRASARSPRVRLLGHVDDAVLAGLLADAGALAYVSSYEGFGLPVLEAMAAGVPVLTTTAPALAELTGAEDPAGPAALLVDLDGPDPYGAGLRDALTRILSEESLRQDLVTRGRRRAAVYSWDVAAERAWTAITAARAGPVGGDHRVGG